jgi:hypothetical protein
LVRQIFLVEPDYNTRTWTYENTGRNTRVTAHRKDRTIVLKGVHRGKALNRNFTIGSGFWNQLFQIGLGKFATSGDAVRYFHAIGTSGIGDMKIARFRASREGRETINLEGGPLETIHLTISLAGIRSVLWTGHYWFLSDSGLFLRYLNRPVDPDRGNRMVLENPGVRKTGRGEGNLFSILDIL